MKKTNKTNLEEIINIDSVNQFISFIYRLTDNIQKEEYEANCKLIDEYEFNILSKILYKE